MTALIEQLKSNPDGGYSKSHILGIERGRIWSEDFADYFDLREWSEYEPEDVEAEDLPHDEYLHYLELCREIEMEWEPYIKGWLYSVKEARKRY